ncbi:hypothetical protein RB195_014191 [Necator americanus]|uniref:Uncharacterized protein n=1 Tax=Necator americanus TaxID=51031 RepID=A0ABR1DZ03_NECAM
MSLRVSGDHLTGIPSMFKLIEAFEIINVLMIRKPGGKSFLVNAPYEPVDVELHKSINLCDFIQLHKDQLRRGRVQIYGKPLYSTHVFLYGEGKFLLEAKEHEILLWIQNDSHAVLGIKTEERQLGVQSMTLCASNSNYLLDVKKGYAITLQMLPK